MTRWVWVLVGSLVVGGIAGCSHQRPSILFEREARSPVAVVQELGKMRSLQLEPVSVTVEHEGVEVTIRHASDEYLHEYFKNAAIFGSYAGPSPYFSINAVFYVRIVNHGTGKVHFDPNRIVILDDTDTQYEPLSPDYIIALSEAKPGVGRMTRAAIESAPGPYGIPVGRFAAGLVPQSQRRLAMLKQVDLQPGFIYPGVIYDGLIAFLRPHPSARKLRVLVPDVKTDYDQTETSRRSLIFTAEFAIAGAPAP